MIAVCRRAHQIANVGRGYRSNAAQEYDDAVKDISDGGRNHFRQDEHNRGPDDNVGRFAQKGEDQREPRRI